MGDLRDLKTCIIRTMAMWHTRNFKVKPHNMGCELPSLEWPSSNLIFLHLLSCNIYVYIDLFAHGPRKRHATWSTLAQIWACCMTAPSHYLKQCWLWDNHPRAISSERSITLYICTQYFQMWHRFPRANGLCFLMTIAPNVPDPIN